MQRDASAALKTKVEIGPRGDRQAEAGKRDVQRYIGAGSSSGGKPSAQSGGPDWFTAQQRKN